MKINRIQKIKNYRIYKDFNWPAELGEFTKFNLIYGWNGSGKTTLSGLFSYLQHNRDILDADVRFEVDGTVVHGNAISNSTLPSVRVFNRDTVSLSLFEVPSETLAPVYYLGEDSAEKQKIIEELKVDKKKKLHEKTKLSSDKDSIERELGSFLRNKASEIKALLTTSGGGPYRNYNKSDFSNKLELLSSLNENPFCLTSNAYEDNLKIKDGLPLKKITPITFTLSEPQKLYKEVAEIVEQSVVSQVISELQGNPDIASWVQRGLELHNNEEHNVTCQFCKSPVSNDRIKQLEGHFNDKLTSFQMTVENKKNQINNIKSDLDRIILPNVELLYPHFKEVYNVKYKQWQSNKLIMIRFLNALILALEEKIKNPFNSLALHDFVFVSSSTGGQNNFFKVLGFIIDGAQIISVSSAFPALNEINNILKKHNDYSDNFELEADSVRKELEVHTVSNNLDEWNHLKISLNDFESKLLTTELRLEELDQQVLELEKEIKEFVKPAEELNIEMAGYLGRYELTFAVCENGYTILRNGQPALHLSEGERTAIAFMYFLKTLEDSSFDIENGIVVIDDPISSLDFNSMYSAFAFMKDRVKNIGQLFVLTHNFTFFRHVRKWFFSEPKLPVIQGFQGPKNYRISARFYMLETSISNNERATHLSTIDPLLSDYESEYHFLFKKVYDFVQSEQSQPLENYYGLPNIARRLLESFLTFKLPNYPAGKIEKKLDDIEFDTPKKTRILRFLHVHSHFDQVVAPEHDLSLLSEAPTVLNDLMELIEKVDPEHYQGMQSLIND